MTAMRVPLPPDLVRTPSIPLEADNLAGALMASLTGDAAACITALTPGDAAPDRVRLTTRREREPHQLLRRIEWDE